MAARPRRRARRCEGLDALDTDGSEARKPARVLTAVWSLGCRANPYSALMLTLALAVQSKSKKKAKTQHSAQPSAASADGPPAVPVDFDAKVQAINVEVSARALR